MQPDEPSLPAGRSFGIAVRTVFRRIAERAVLRYPDILLPEAFREGLMPVRQRKIDMVLCTLLPDVLFLKPGTLHSVLTPRRLCNRMGNVGVDLITAAFDTRPDSHQDIPGITAEPLHKRPDRFFQDTGRCPAPTGMHGTDNMPAGIIEQDGDAIRNLDPDQDILPVRNDGVRNRGAEARIRNNHRIRMFLDRQIDMVLSDPGEPADLTNISARVFAGKKSGHVAAEIPGAEESLHARPEERKAAGIDSMISPAISECIPFSAAAISPESPWR